MNRKNLFKCVLLWAVFLVSIFCGQTSAQGIFVGDGVSWQLNGNELNVDGTIKIASDGILEQGKSSISLTGNWNTEPGFIFGEGALIFNGSSGNQIINIRPNESFKNIIVNKDSGDAIFSDEVFITNSLTLLKGDVNLNGTQITLGPNAVLAESPGSTVKGNAGFISAQRILNEQTHENIAGLGISIYTFKMLGMTTIKRGHQKQNDAGSESISRYFDVIPEENNDLGATIIFNYDESELDTLNEAALRLYQLDESSSIWHQHASILNQQENFIKVNEINSFSRITAATGFHSPPLITAIPEVDLIEDESIEYLIDNWFPFINDPDTPDEQLEIIVTYDDSAKVTAEMYEHSVITFTPFPNWWGLDSVNLFVSDGLNEVNSVVYVSVASVNDIPEIEAPLDSLIISGNSPGIINIWEMVEDIETPDSLLTCTIETGTDSLITEFDSGLGEIKILPEKNFIGSSYIILNVCDADSGCVRDTITIITESTTGIDEWLTGIPKEYELKQNFPNPFNPSTTIYFGLPHESNVVIQIFDVLGRKVYEINETNYSAGFHSITWNASDQSSGIYFYRIDAVSSARDGDFTSVKKMMLLK